MKMKDKHDVFNSLFFYGNEEKLDVLLGRIYTSVVSEYEIQTKNTKHLSGSFKGGLNKIFSKFGLPEIEVEFNGNLEHEHVKSVISSITFDSKVEMLISYYKKNGRYPCIDLLHGEYYEYKNNKVVNEKKINNEKLFEENLIGVINGQFAAKRIYPPVESLISLSHDVRIFEETRLLGDVKKSVEATIYKDFSDKSNNLWNMYTVKSNVIQGSIPILIGNIRTVSQYSLIQLYRQSEYMIKAIGALNCENNTVVCDPIAFSLC